jgi:Zn-dependent peptidase ImmA (M78 family)
LSTSEKSSAVEKLEAFEAGETRPTRNQLLRFASLYRRPLTTFYMNERPEIADRGEDFRTLSGPVSRQENALLDALLRDVRARQDLVRSILEDDEDASRFDVVGSLTIDDPIPDVATRLREALAIQGDNWAVQHASPDALFANLRDRVESLGVFVLLIGNLGSHHSNISEKAFRGFAIADDIAPFIVINDQDARTARSFTLIHELVHLFLGATGVSGAPSTAAPRTSSARIERFCNDAAGEFLLPTALIPAGDDLPTIHAANTAITAFAADCNVSEPMVAYRFRRLGRISEDIYGELNAMYTVRWQAQRQRDRERGRETEGGPTDFVVRKHRLGKALLTLVGQTLRENQLTHTTAAQMLGVKPSSVEPLLRGVETISGTHVPETGP